MREAKDFNTRIIYFSLFAFFFSLYVVNLHAKSYIYSFNPLILSTHYYAEKTTLSDGSPAAGVRRRCGSGDDVGHERPRDARQCQRRKRHRCQRRCYARTDGHSLPSRHECRRPLQHPRYAHRRPVRRHGVVHRFPTQEAQQHTTGAGRDLQPGRLARRERQRDERGGHNRESHQVLGRTHRRIDEHQQRTADEPAHHQPLDHRHHAPLTLWRQWHELRRL